MPIAITGSAQAVTLGGGYALRAPGLQGDAEVLQPGAASARSAGRGLDSGLASLNAALRTANVTHTRDIELALQPIARAGGGAMRSAHGEVALELEVPDAGPDHGQLVVSIDDTGALRWHLPDVLTPAAAVAGGSRGAGAVKRFRIPAVLAPPPAGVASLKQRSVLGAVGRRVLKVFVYPLTDPLFGVITEMFARQWEDRKRPHRLRRFTPADYTSANVADLEPAEVAAMAAAGPVLLFIHGTFSTSHGAFRELPPATMTQLHQRYGQRVIAFDHPTLADDPQSNARWLLSQLPANMQADVVSHSRGGLVARVLAERPANFNFASAHIDVRRLVLAGVPNAGTPLADPDHMVDMIDRLTTVLTLFPSGAATETLEALVTVIKMLGRGLLTGLDGLACMRPNGQFLRALNIKGGAALDYFAVASDYAPKDRGLRALVSGAADNIADFVFGNSGNDLVVPTDGVHASNGQASFPLPQDRVLMLNQADGAMHTALFGQAAVEQKLLDWLPGT